MTSRPRKIELPPIEKALSTTRNFRESSHRGKLPPIASGTISDVAVIIDQMHNGRCKRYRSTEPLSI